MTDTYERCSCGARDRAKCEKENGLNTGKMCLKPLPDFPEGYIFPERMKEFTLEDWLEGLEKKDVS